MKLQVRTMDVDRWLTAPLPLAFAPVGELGQEYKLIWEKDAKSYAELHNRCSEIPGYSGIVESRDGLGVRVRCARWDRATKAHQRTDALEAGLGEVRELLKQLLVADKDASRPGGSSKRQWHQGPVVLTSKAVQELPREADDWTAWYDVPGDGSCLWHSLAVVLEERWNNYVPQQGLELKQRLLQEMRESRDALADVLGCNRDSVSRLIQEWEGQNVWGDARTWLAAAYLRAVNVLIFNADDKQLEVLCPFGKLNPQTMTWVVRFEKEHYSPGYITNWNQAKACLAKFKLQPWKSQCHLRGGSRQRSRTPQQSRRDTQAPQPRPRGIQVVVMQAPTPKRTWIWERELALSAAPTPVQQLEQVVLRKLAAELMPNVIGLNFLCTWRTLEAGPIPRDAWNRQLEAMPIYRISKLHPQAQPTTRTPPRKDPGGSDMEDGSHQGDRACKGHRRGSQ